MRPVVMAMVVMMSAQARAALESVSHADPTAIELLSDDFSESDLQLISAKMSSSLLESAIGVSTSDTPVRVCVGEIRNETSDYMNLEALGDRLTVQLIKSGRLEVVDVMRRKEIAREYEYQRSGYVDPKTAHAAGQQVAVDYIITGVLRSTMQKEGASAIIDYRLSMVATEVKTGVARWAEDQALRKHVEQAGISPRTSQTLHVVGFGTAALTMVVGAGFGVFSLAHARAPSTRTNNDIDSEDFMEETTVPGSPPEPVSGVIGCGLLVLGPVIGLLTYALVPAGNPAITE